MNAVTGATGERADARRDGDRVTMFEIFFDLVFVLALMRVVDLMEAQPTPAGFGRGVLLLLLLWWAWCAYIWLGNRVRLDRGRVVVAILVAMCALFVAALAIPGAWESPAGTLSPALVLAVAFIVVRASYFAVFLSTSGRDRRLRTQLLIDAIPQTGSSALLIVGAVLGGDLQSVCWAVAFGLDFGVGWLASRYNGWRVASPAHFVERHGLVLIIALGETVLSSGAGLGSTMRDSAVEPRSIAAALLAFAIVLGIWWSYFRGPSIAAHRALLRAAPARRPALARDGYTLGHLPLVAGTVFVALGVRLLLEDIAVAPAAPAHWGAIAALSGGLACYLLGLGLFARLATGAWSRAPLIAGVLTIVLGAVALGLASLAALALSAALVVIAALATASQTRRTAV
ncbi:low temperature requirement protein A [Agromyces intestinalis]|uniref:Low temperature requirement protein A n=1 Tax=Agromyces intestinalis TaxID=2592652 RepID=A0A5C1YBX8_9MICO|nr:low temperature requirement protein A [Agromyces intestinalis]QEO13078.1 low temperature requirement protein A [Agromyces intestinalis]